MARLMGFNFRLERRVAPPLKIRVAVPLISVALAFLVGLGLIASTGADALFAYSQIWRVFASPSGVVQALVITTPLLLVASGLAVAFRAGFWNIGAEGQYVVGAIAGTGVALSVSSYLGELTVPVMFLAAFLAGAAWGAVPAFLKVHFSVNEVLTSLMMVYIAIRITIYLVFGPWKDPRGLGFPGTELFPTNARLPHFPSSTLDVGIIMAIAVAIILYWVIRRSRLGFEIRVIGDSPQAARYAGIPHLQTMILVMTISGGLAGLAGIAIVSGQLGYLRAELASGFGFTGIIIAWLGGLNMLAIIPAAFLFGGLEVSADILQIELGLPEAFAVSFEAIIFLFVITGEVFLRYRVHVLRGEVS